MKRTFSRFFAVIAMALASVAAHAQEAAVSDFPTQARVEYVLACMRDNPGPRQEMIYKCSCAVDSIAKEMKYDAWVDVSTIASANTISGERGAAIRDAKGTRDVVAIYRDTQARAKKNCFIGAQIQ